MFEIHCFRTFLKTKIIWKAYLKKKKKSLGSIPELLSQTLGEWKGQRWHLAITAGESYHRQLQQAPAVKESRVKSKGSSTARLINTTPRNYHQSYPGAQAL